MATCACPRPYLPSYIIIRGSSNFIWNSKWTHGSKCLDPALCLISLLLASFGLLKNYTQRDHLPCSLSHCHGYPLELWITALRICCEKVLCLFFVTDIREGLSRWLCHSLKLQVMVFRARFASAASSVYNAFTFSSSASWAPADCTIFKIEVQLIYSVMLVSGIQQRNSVIYVSLKFFLMWIIFKVFVEFVMVLLLLYVLVFWPWGMWAVSFLIRDRICTPCIGRRSLIHGIPREISIYPFSDSFRLQVTTEYCIWFPVPCSRFLLLFCFICIDDFLRCVSSLPLCILSWSPRVGHILLCTPCTSLCQSMYCPLLLPYFYVSVRF